MKALLKQVGTDFYLSVRSETPIEAEELAKFINDGFDKGFYHLGSALSSDHSSLDIAVDYENDENDEEIK